MAKNHNANKKEMLKMAAKAGKQHSFKFEETEYTFQHPGLREGIKIRQRSKDQFGNIDEEKYYEEIMKHVIVQPKTSWDYWEENEGFNEVMKEAATFLNK